MAGYLTPPAVAPGNVLTSAAWNLIRDDLDFGMVRPIADIILGASAASIDFTSIPATFAQLLLVAYLRSDKAAVTSDLITCRFNNDSGATYSYQSLQALNAGISAAGAVAATALLLGTIPAATAPASTFATVELLIPHYAGVANYKTWSGRNFRRLGATAGDVATNWQGGEWSASAAVNRLTLLASASNLLTGSRAPLYGMGGI